MNISAPLLPNPIITEHLTASTHSRNTRAADAPPPLENREPGTQIGSTGNVGRMTAPTPDNELDFSKGVIYGEAGVSPPSTSYTLRERMHRIEAYTERVVAQIKNIETGEEGERNVRFQKVRQFLEPAGYFSAGLLAAGLKFMGDTAR